MRNGIGSITKLAVVGALILVGAVGMGWAQLPSGAVNSTASMSTSFSVTNVAQITPTPKNVANEALLTSATFGSPPIIDASNFGSLGTLRVKTNSMAWDIRMKTQNGGTLIDKSQATVDSIKINYDLLGGIISRDTAYKAAPTLTYTDDSLVVLLVGIGVAKTGKGLGMGTAATVYPLVDAVNGAGSVIQPVWLSKAHVLGTKGDSTKYVSFADSIGKHYATISGTLSGDFQYGINAGTTALNNADGWTTIGTKGFPTPSTNFVADEEHFYVNVAIPDKSYGPLTAPIGKNKNGKYEEKFTFDLIAGF